MGFRYLTSGESHGKCLNAIIEGIPSGFKINEEFINSQLARRQLGYGRGGRMQIEKDTIKINSGVRHGFTTGAPICIEIENKDWENWKIPMSTSPVDISNPAVTDLVVQKKIIHVRPGHADLAGALKYNHSDIRNVLERSSARETAMRVAIGGFAMNLLLNFGIEIFSHVLRIGTVAVDISALPDNYTIVKEFAEKSDVRCADYAASVHMRQTIDEAKEAGDTLGGIFEVVALGIPVGLGSYVHWDKRIDGLLAQAVMSIPAIKSVNIGLGKVSAQMPGSKLHDEIFPKDEETAEYKRKTNHSGGIEGGVTNGNPVIVRAAMKPIPTMKKPLRSINIETGEEHVAHYERSDVCAVPAAGVVGEAMIAAVLLKAFLEKFGGDSYEEVSANFENYRSIYRKR
jgi:chorismate synthase